MDCKCDVCGDEMIWLGDHDVDDDGVVSEWICMNCGFVGHYVINKEITEEVND